MRPSSILASSLGMNPCQSRGPQTPRGRIAQVVKPGASAARTIDSAAAFVSEYRLRWRCG